MSTLPSLGGKRAHWPSRTCRDSTRALVGTSFKHEHLPAIAEQGLTHGFFEVHAENYMGDGGPAHRALEGIRRDYPLSVHGVGMSIGASQPLNAQHLERFRRVVDQYQPMLVSEHLAWSTHEGLFFNDLLPLPYTRETLTHVCEHIDQVQAAIHRPLLLENPATYVTFASSTMSEPDFMNEVLRRSGCGLLLDVNNVFVSATNHAYSASAYLAQLACEHVAEIHLAGHTRQLDDREELLLIDSHDCPVSDEVWRLYESVIARTGPVPTLIEWDSQLPEWQVLRDQAEKARGLMHTLSVVRGSLEYAC